MSSVRTFTSRAARFIVTTLVATLACAVVAPGATTVRASGTGLIDYFPTTTTSQTFSAPDDNAFDGTGNFTFEMWVKPDSTCMAMSCMLVNKESSWEFELQSGRLYYALTNSAGSYNWYSAETIFRVDTWVHLAISVERSTNTMRIYLNGELYNTITNATTVPSSGYNSSLAFTVGGRAANSVERFSGSMDEVRLYTTVRSQANIRSDMHTHGTAAGVDTTGLTAYYDFNEGTGTTIANDAPGATSATALTASSTPTWSDVKTTTVNPTGTYNRTIVSFPRSYITSAGGWTPPAGVTKVDALVVGGGGGGGGGNDNTGWSGGGGGAGGYKTVSNATVTPNSAVKIGVGGGGHRGTLGNYPPTNGGGSVFGTTTVSGGGFGSQSGVRAGSGGSGGGGAYGNATAAGSPGTGIAGEGYAGGTSLTSCCAGGGGGGSASAGGNATTTTTGGAAGNGTANSITGTSVFYAAGGAGQGYNTAGSAGSAGGTAVYASGSNGTGSGGGGGGGASSRYLAPGFGGGGIVIVSYANPVSIDANNRSVYFSGSSSSYVSIPDNNALDLGLDFTAEAWVYPTATDCTGNHVFMGKESSYLFAMCNNVISYALRDAGGSTWAWYQSTVPISLNTWAHFAFVRSAGRLTIYKNGGLIVGGTEYSTTSGVPTATMNNSGNAFIVGGRGGCAVECFTGHVDDVRIWNYARSSTAIAQNYNKRVAGNVLYLPFDESVGTTVANFSPTFGSTLNGTNVGASIANAWPTGSSTYTAANISGFLAGYDYQTGGAVTFAISQNGSKGTATVSASTGAFSYVANAGATGNDSFTYSVTGANGTSTYTFSVTAPSQPMASSKTFVQGSDVAIALNSPTSLGYNNPSTAFTLGEIVRATLSVTNGTINLTQGSTTIASGALNSTSVTIDGTQSQVNTALNSATVTATSAIPTRATLDIGLKPADQTVNGRSYTYNNNGHFYTKIIPLNGTYATALSSAASMTFGGRTGYLATIQSSSENTTITGINGANSWIGTTDSDVEGTWRWKGNDTNSVFRTGGATYRNRYNNWNTNEPNDSGGAEDLGEHSSGGGWNDCGESCSRTTSIIEFDPMSSRTVTNLDFTKSLSATASSARNLGLGTTFLNTSTWANGEIVTATVTATAGTVAFTAGSTTITAGASGSSTVTFEGSVANMNTALNTVTVTPAAAGDSTVTFTYGVKRASTGSYIYNATTDHFYFSNSTTANNSTARSNATSAKWAGTSGYLATVTSEAEHITVRNLNNVNSWSGGTDNVSKGQWAWDAPDAYQNFSDFEVGLAGAVSYFDPGTGEPSGNGNYLVVNFGTSLSYWDDAPDTATYAQIYEFAPIDTTLTYNVTAGAALTITTPTTGLNATTGTPYSLTLATSGGAGSNVFALASGTLPTGLALNSSTGVISGTSSGTLTTSAITVSVTDANSATVTTNSFTITSTPLACTTSTTIVGNYTVEKVTATGSCTWTVPTGVTSLDAFVVGGGGGGGADGGGGGGGGAYQPINGYGVSAGDAITVTVGDGGAAGTWGGTYSGAAGGASSLLKGATTIAAANGGRGGAGGPSGAIGAGGTSTTGFAGGAGGTASTTGGTFGGVGKNGASNYFFDTVSYYGGGGAGGMYGSSAASTTAACNNAGTAGGTGGGGSAGTRTGLTHTVGCSGAANTGGGGGGGVANSPQTSGGAGGSGIAVIRYATDPLDAFPASIGTPAYRYIAENYQTLDTARKQWVDSSGNGRHSALVTGSPSVTTTTGNGTSGTIRTVSGTTTDGIRFSSFTPTTSNKYTLFHVTRYSGATKGRIIQGVNYNWLSGFWDNSLGVAYHNGWLTSTVNRGTNMLNWQLNSDQNTVFRQNGLNKVTTSTGTYDSQLSINYGVYPGENSDYNAAEIIMYNGELTAAQIRQVENYLARTYNLQGYDFTNAALGANSVGTYTATRSGTASTGDTSKLNLSWVAPQDTTGVTGYKVEYKKAADSTWTTFSASTAGTSTTLTGLDAGTSYDTRVTPVDSGATNRPSVTATVSTWGTSSVALGTMPSSPVTGTNYTLSATVTGPSSTTGTVNFMDGGTTISACGTTSVLSGVATCSWTPTTFGTHNITASYTGDTSYLSSSTVSATAVSVDYGACATTSATTGRYTYLKVTTTGICKITTLPSGVESVDVFVVGGGGGGGENAGSGGSGGGGYYAERVAASSSSALIVTVGAGGRAGNYPADSTTQTALRDGGNGEASSISWDTYTFTGNGGTGGQTHWTLNQCGGGTAVRDATVATGGTGSGSGGTASTGGAGGLNGVDVNYNASAGSAGFSNSITGTTTSYGGGGGGGAWGTGAGGAGGAGGGGAGSGNGQTTGTSGTANTGGGGGGGMAGCAAGGAGGSGIAIIRYANVPTITTQPAAVTKSSGQSHTFSVTPSASGAVTGDFTYQWRKDGVNITGATSSSYTISNLVLADAGTYSVVAKSYGSTGAVSTVTSSDAVLTMNKGTQTITFGTLSDRIYGVSAFSISSTNSASLQNTYTSNDTSVCTVGAGSLSTNTTTATLTVVSAGTCSITASQVGDTNYNAATSVTQTFVVATKTLTISGMTASNKEYDRSTTATLSFTSATLNGVVSGDTVTINSAGATGTFNDKTVANGKTVSATGIALSGTHAARYSLTQPTATANITAKVLTVTGITANNKEYDGTTAATSLLIKGSAALSGVIGADVVTLSTTSATATFADKTIASNKTVTVAGLTISGADAGNYTLTQPTTTASITAKELTVSGITANNRTYDATTSATSQLVLGSAALVGKQGSDAVTLSTASATATFADKNVGVGKTVTIAGLTISGADAGNYTLTQPTTTASILAKGLTVTGITANNRVYDSTTDATSQLVLGSAALSGVESGDSVTLSTASAAATFATKTVGTSKVVTLSGLSVSGADASNYTLSQPTTTANITAKELTVSGITANNRTYDATTSATSQLVLGSAALVGKQGSDAVTLSTASATATFADKNVGVGKTVTIAGLTISGADAGNYTLTQPTTTASVLAKAITVTGITANNRVYDRTTDATSQLVKSSAALSGVVSGDTVTLDHNSATASFATKIVGTAKTVTITGITIGGADAGNYTLSQPTTTANITAKELTVTGITASDKNYDSTTSAVINTGSAAFSGIVSGDAVTIDVSSAIGTFSNALYGTNKTVTMSGITSSGADAGNYSITQPTTTASIARKTLTVTGITATSRTYNAGTSATSILNVSGAALSGIEGSDAVSLNTGSATGSFSDKNVGTGKSIQVAGLTVSGTAASNYTLVQPTTTGAITAKTLTVTGITASNRVYNASASATSVLDTTNAALSGVETNDTVTLSTGSIAGVFADKNVGTAKSITISGLTIGGTDAGNYTLTQPTTTANITAKTLTVTGITANNRTYDASTSATALLVKSSAALSGVETNDTVTLDHSGATASFANKTVGSGKIVTVVGITIGGTDAGNYTLTQPTTTANITAKTLTVTGITANNRTYDASTSATSQLVKGSAALSGVESGDTVTLATGSAVGVFADKNVGVGKTITISGLTIGSTDAGNYTLTQPTTTASVLAKTLTVTGITANNRTYDASTSATALLVKSSAALSGVETNDTVTLDHSGATATFATKTAENSKTVTVAGLTISGTDAGNYTLTQPTTTANITAKTLTVTGITANNRVYNASTSATALLVKSSAALSGVETNDTVNLSTSSATATFADKNVGTGKTVTVAGLTISGTDAGNYTLTQPTTTANITAKTLTVTGITANNRVYNASTSATALLVKSSAALSGVETNDTVNLSTSSATATFADKNVGTGKTVTVAGLTISGTDAGNYTLTQPTTTANITAKTLTVTGITANTKLYDGTTIASISTTNAAVNGVETGDTANLDVASATGSFADTTLASGKTVQIAGLTVTGTDAGNYSVTQPTTTADMIAATVGLAWNTPSAITYGTTLSSTQLNATATTAGTFTYDPVLGTQLNAGTHSLTVTFNPTNQAYTPDSTTVTIVVNKKALTVTGLTTASRIYDATTNATTQINTSSISVNGVVSGDTITANTSSMQGSYANKNIGVGKAITVSGISVDGAAAANYTVTQPSLTGTITSKALTVTGITANNREYNRSVSATALLVKASAALSGVVSGDNVTLDHSTATATFADKTVGNSKAVSIAGITIGGADAGNYSLAQPSTTASIWAATLTISGLSATDRVYDSTADATALLDTSSTSLTGVVSGDTVTLSTTNISGSFTNSAIGSNKTITTSGSTIGGADAGNYVLTQPTTTASITAKTLTISGLTISNKEYDGSSSATSLVNKASASLSGVISGDTVSLSTDSLTASFATKVVGTNRTVTTNGSTISGTHAANYSLTQPTLTATITAKTLTVTGITANNRVYDATTSATSLLVKGSAALSGVIGVDVVTLDHAAATATFATKNIGSNKTISIAGMTISGTDAGNYTLTQPATTASITAKTLTVTGITANNRVYDATTNATSLLVKGSAALSGVVSGDAVTLDHSAATASFSSKNVGPSKTVSITGITIGDTDAGNYTLTQPATTASITAKTLTVTGITANNRVYDATTDAHDQLVTSSAALSGVVSGDVVSFSVSGINGTFATKTIGNNKTISITGITIGDTDAGNYTLTQPTATANITAKTLTVTGITANNKVYNGNTVTGLTTTNAAFVGVQGNDTVTVDLGSISGTFASANVGQGVAVTISGITATGADAGNYTVTQPSSSANITQASAGLTWSQPSDIVFGPSLTSTQLNASASINGTFVYTPAAGTRLDVGTHQLSVTFTPDSSNYAVATQNVSLTVTRKALAVTAVTSSVTYGTAITSSFTTSGLEGSDAALSVTYTYAGTNSTTYAGSSTAPVNAGTYSATPSAIALSSGLTSNYSITYNAAQFTINKATQSVLTASASTNTVTYAPSPNEPTISLSTSGGSGDGAVTYAVTSSGGVCSVNGTTLTAHEAGTCTVVATKAESANFLSRDSAAITITVDKATQELSFTAIADKTYGDANFSVTATSTSGLVVTLTASPANVCQVVSGLAIQILSNGDCTISASQSGNSNYLAATVATGSSGSRTFSVARKTLTINGTSASNRVYDGTRDATALLSFTSSSLVGVVSGDNVAINSSGATAQFANKNVGTNKAISVVGTTITGTHASRYTLIQPTGLTATVTTQTVTVGGVTVPTRAYNATTTAQLSTGSYNFSGVVNGDAVTLDDSAYTATFASAGAGTMKVVTISGLALAGLDSQNYVLTQPILQGDIVKAVATIAFASTLSATFNNTPRALAMTTSPASLSITSSYSGSGVTSYGPTSMAPTNAGTYTLVATINDVNYEGSNTSAWTINKQTVSLNVTAGSLTGTFNGAAHPVPMTTSPTGKFVTINYTGTNGTVYNSSFAPTNAGTYQVTGTVVESNFDGTIVETLTVSAASQSAITFVSDTSATYGTPHRLIAVGGSGSGALSYVRDGGPCSVDATSGIVTITGTGQCVFHAERAASTNYIAKSSLGHTISVAKGTQTISFTSLVPSNTAKDSTYTPSAVATSGLSPSISVGTGLGSVCTFNSGVVTFLASGVCEIIASQPGDSNWLAATSMKQIVEVGKLSQAIAFPQPGIVELGDPDFVLEASASSGLPISSAVTSGGSVCSLSSNGVVSILSVGSCTIEVTQAGDSVFSVASPVSRTITVLPALPSAPHIASVSAGDGTVTVGYLAPSTNGGSPLVSYSITATSPTAPTISNTNCSTSTLACTLVGLVNGASYSITVTAFNVRGAGAVSESAEVLIPAPSLLAVQNVSGTRANTTINVTWVDPNTYGDGVFTEYKVFLRERGGSFGSPITVQSITARAASVSGGFTTPGSGGVIRSLTTVARSAQFTNLDPSKLYETKIVTITSTATTEASTNTASALVMPLANPSAPRDLSIEAPTASTARVSWTTPLVDGGSTIQSYTVTSNIGQCQAASALTTSCVVSNLQSGDSLTISVRATNGVGNSIAASATYVVPSAPGAPILNVISTTTTSATISWQAPQSNGGRIITSYSAIAYETATPSNTVRCTSAGLSCVMYGLKSSINYTVKVRATNSVGTGAYSSTSTFDTLRPITSDWTNYRNAAANGTASTLSLPPAPARVTVQSLSGGRRTQVTAVRATRDANIPVTYALISIRTRTNKLLARIKVLVDPTNPSTSVSVPYASSKVKVSVQFANDIGISSGGPAGINIAEGNTFEWTTVSNETHIKGTQVKGDLYFARGKSTLTYTMQKTLKKMATTVKARGGVVYVSGFAQQGELKSAWMLEPLARARAEAVSKYLAKIGVRQWITFHGTAGSAFNGWEPVSGRQVIITTVMPEEI